MKHVIQFPSGKYFHNEKREDLWNGAYSEDSIFDATLFDHKGTAKALVGQFRKGTEIVSISEKEIFLHKLRNAA